MLLLVYQVIFFNGVILVIKDMYHIDYLIQLKLYKVVYIVEVQKLLLEIKII